MKKRSAVGVALTPMLERSIAGLVRSGRYRSQSEAVREAVRLLLERERQRKAVVGELRRQIAKGVAEVERGDVVDGDEYMRQWAANEGRALRRRRKSA